MRRPPPPSHMRVLRCSSPPQRGSSPATCSSRCRQPSTPESTICSADARDPGECADGPLALHARPGCDPPERGAAAARSGGRRALGGRQGKRVRPWCGRRCACCSRGGSFGALRRDAARGARAPQRPPERAHHRHGAGGRRRDRGGANGSARARGRDGSRPGRHSRSPRARHGHGTLGTLRARFADAECRRCDEPLRGVGGRLRVHPPADRPLSRSDRSPGPGLGGVQRHLANSAGTLRFPEAAFDAVRCGIALYGISPFGTSPADDGLEPALRWESHLALVKQLGAGESTGYGRRFVAERPTWIGIVPVGYADGFRRDLTGTEVLVGRRSASRGGHGLDGCVRRRALRRACRRHAGDADRRGRLRRGSRSGRWHDRVRDRDGTRHEPEAGELGWCASDDSRRAHPRGAPRRGGLDSRRSRARRAAREARSSTSTSPAESRRLPRGSSHDGSAALPSRSRSAMAPGE